MKTVLVAAVTADGFIGRDASHLADWTGKADKKLFVEVTKAAGIMVMGSRTFATIGRALPGRRTIVYTSKPAAITAEGVETTSEEPAALVKRLAEQGAAGLAVAGGASIYQQFMAAGVVDELYITVAPLLFGTGVPLFGGELDVRLELLETRILDTNTVLLHYKIIP
ncbi:MAG TPA: dihydrofolate reductase family protein [Candidatus Saccharimonadales bacterium]|nr:dihydrofolate reductase family protein [Candidatus Saccharimonadales bacterium]